MISCLACKKRANDLRQHLRNSVSYKVSKNCYDMLVKRYKLQWHSYGWFRATMSVIEVTLLIQLLQRLQLYGTDLRWSWNVPPHFTYNSQYRMKTTATINSQVITVKPSFWVRGKSHWKKTCVYCTKDTIFCWRASNVCFITKEVRRRITSQHARVTEDTHCHVLFCCCVGWCRAWFYWLLDVTLVSCLYQVLTSLMLPARSFAGNR